MTYTAEDGKELEAVATATRADEKRIRVPRNVIDNVLES
jgi:hypothetical protein